MEGFGLLVGHMIGDYLLQNGWMAGNKSNTGPTGPCPGTYVKSGPGRYVITPGDPVTWKLHRESWWTGHLACTVHCLLYTLAIWACSFWWIPWWGLAACFLAHWPIDRWRLARLAMRHCGQEDFATGPLSPWSVVVVDNTYHLVTLFLIGILAECPWSR